MIKLQSGWLKEQIEQAAKDFENQPHWMKLEAFNTRLKSAKENQAAYPSVLMKCRIELLEIEIYKLENNVIVQRKVEVVGGTYWQDVHLSDGRIDEALFELNDPVGTEYRIIHDKCGTAFVTQPQPKGIKFDDNST